MTTSLHGIEAPSLALPADRLNHLCETFDDLATVIQFALIHALEKSAVTNRYSMKQDFENDGWYKYRGSIDTSYVADAVEWAVRCKIAHDHAKKESDVFSG